MKKQNGLNVGWVESSIGALLRSDAHLPGRFGYVLVTSVDSSRDLSTLHEAQEITRRHPEARFVGSALLLPSSQAAEVTGAFKLFTGFDEVWWFNEAPPLPKPEDVSLVAPLNVATDEISPALVAWMKDSKCRLGLGDGIGLNFVTPDDAVAELLEHTAMV